MADSTTATTTAQPVDATAQATAVAGAAGGAGGGAGADTTAAAAAAAPAAAGAGAGAGAGSSGGADTDAAIPVYIDKHVAYVISLDKMKDTFEYCVTEHLRMSGVYWGLMAMEIMTHGDDMNKSEIVEWVLRCQHKDCGGFGGNEGHDPHLLYTLSAVQLLAICDSLDRVDPEPIAKYGKCATTLQLPALTHAVLLSLHRYVAGLQQADGSFAGDEWGEIDTRFSYCALSCLSILKRMDSVDVKAATDYVASCQNFDGGFGCTPVSDTSVCSHEAAVCFVGVGCYDADTVVVCTAGCRVPRWPNILLRRRPVHRQRTAPCGRRPARLVAV